MWLKAYPMRLFPTPRRLSAYSKRLKASSVDPWIYSKAEKAS
jgi:predicted DNA-binding transcriptional regulator AlpA